MKRLLVLLILLSTITAVQAFDLDVSISPGEKVIRMNETAIYEITVEHDSSEIVYVEMYSLDIAWSLRTKETLMVPPEGLTTQLLVNPIRRKDPGYYGIQISFHARKFATTAKETILVGLKPEVDILRLYTPALRTSATIPAEIDPREKITILLDVENMNRRNISDMTAYLRSNLINKDIPISILPNEEKQFRFEAELDPGTRPQEDTLYISLVTEHENRTIRFDVKPIKYSIVEYGGIEEELSQSKTFLRLRQDSQLTNTGNNKKTLTYRVDTDWFTDFFVTTMPEVAITDGFYQWQVTLEPDQTRSISVSWNYWPLFILFIAIILLVISYYLFRSPIVLIKNVRRGDPQELRVSIHIKNRSSSAIGKVELSDKVHKMFLVPKRFGPGEVHPESVSRLVRKSTNEPLGTRLLWNVMHLKSGEEAVVQYTIKSHLRMIGTITLGTAKADFWKGTKKHSVRSNSACVEIGN